MGITKKILLMVLLPFVAFATKLDLSGNIQSKLTPTQDTIRITANISIAKGAGLTIGQGKVVRFANGTKITVYGSLRILGASGDSVKLEPETSYWLGIEIPGWSSDMGTDSIIVDYATIRNTVSSAFVADNYDKIRISHTRFYQNKNTTNYAGSLNGGAIRAINAHFNIDNCTFESNRDLTAIPKGGAIYWREGRATIRNSKFIADTSLYGGAIYAESLDSLVVENSLFTDNELDAKSDGFGGSIYSTLGRIVLRGNKFSHGNSFLSDSRYSGIAIYDLNGKTVSMSNDTVTGFKGLSVTSPVYLATDTVTVVNSIFYNNKINPVASLKGGGLDIRAKAVFITGALAYHNSADQGGFAAIYAKDTCMVSHSTIANNNGSYPAISIQTGGKTPFLVGNIIWGNSPQATQTQGEGIFNVIEPVSNLYPGFVDSAAGNFRLSSNSPYIDGGYALAHGLPSKDLDGNPRSKYQSIDPGAYEYQGTRPTKLMGVFTRDTLLTKADYSLTGACLKVLDGVTLRIAAGSTLTFDANCLEVYGALRIEGTETSPVQFASSTAHGWKGVSLYQRSWYDIDDEDSSAIQYLTISNTSGDVITQNSNTVVAYKHSQFVGADGVGALNLTAQSRAYLDSSTFSGTGGGLISAGMLRSQGVISQGPGVVHNIEGDARMDRWTFTKSKITFGPSGGPVVRNSVLDSTPVVIGTDSVTLVNVLAYGVGDNVPAIQQNYGRLKLFHSTITDNAYYGISASQGKVEVKNSIIWNNYGGDGVPQLSLGVNVVGLVKNSIVQNGWSGDNNSDADPKFSDASKHDYTLALGSPAINVGDSTSMVVLMNGLDLASKARFRGAAMDLGPYEYQSGTTHDLWEIEEPVLIRNTIPIKGVSQVFPHFDLLGRTRK